MYIENMCESVTFHASWGRGSNIDDNDDANRDADLDLIKKNQKVSSDAEMDRYDKPLELYLYREETATGVKNQMNKIFKEEKMTPHSTVPIFGRHT